MFLAVYNFDIKYRSRITNSTNISFRRVKEIDDWVMSLWYSIILLIILYASRANMYSAK